MEWLVWSYMQVVLVLVVLSFHLNKTWLMFLVLAMNLGMLLFLQSNVG